MSDWSPCPICGEQPRLCQFCRQPTCYCHDCDCDRAEELLDDGEFRTEPAQRKEES
jgi:hypothetical protein